MEMGRERKRDREGEGMRVNKAEEEVERGGEPQRKQEEHSRGERRGGEGCATEPRLEEGGSTEVEPLSGQ